MSTNLLAVRDIRDVTTLWYSLKDLSSQHKGKLRCLSKTRTSRSGIIKSTVLIGISAIEMLCLKELVSERKKNEKNGKTTRRVYPAFFVASRTPQ
jgi:hypothetical protein